MFIDMHCHLHDEKLSDTDAVVNEYLRDGVDIAINMACCAATSEKGKILAEKYSSVSPTGYVPSTPFLLAFYLFHLRKELL